MLLKRVQFSIAFKYCMMCTFDYIYFPNKLNKSSFYLLRDFAYVARDRLTRIHMCHVFRCDTAARTIANTLRDICKKIMIERSLQLDSNGVNMNGGRSGVTRPTDLPTENRRWIRNRMQYRLFVV